MGWGVGGGGGGGGEDIIKLITKGSLKYIHSDFNDLNIFVTIQICSSHGYFESQCLPLRQSRLQMG